MTWATSRVKDVAELVNGYPFDSNLFSGTGEIPLVRIRDILSDTYTTFVPDDRVPQQAYVRDGDVVVGMDGDFNVVLWNRGAAALNQRLCLLRALNGVDPRFLAYALPSHLGVINDLTYATTVKHLSSRQVREIRLPLPSAGVQRAIADYLDRETAKIDTLISEQQRLIALLKERRESRLLSLFAEGIGGQQVTPTDLGWVDTVPAHWRVANIRRFAQMKTGHTPSRSVPEYWQDTSIPWFTLADVRQLRNGDRTYLGATTSQISELGLANSAAELLPAGTVVLSRTASVGFTGVMPEPMATSQDYWNWVCGPDLVPEFLMWVFRAMRPHLLSLMIGSTHKTIYQPIAASIRIPVPPVEEQRELVTLIEAEDARSRTLTAEAERLIELARERRAALITAAVTGQIEILGVN